SEDSKLQLKTSLENYNRILIVPGQQRPNPLIADLLEKLMKDKKAVVVTDIVSNFQSNHTITYHDTFLPALEDKTALAPDLVISLGKSIISKTLKPILRKTETAHSHIQPADYAPSTLQRLSRNIQTSPLYFLQFLQENVRVADTSYYNSWTNAEERIR